MSDIVPNIAKGSVAEKIRTDATHVGVLLLKSSESDSAMKDRATVADIVANSDEADFTNYVRKTGITASVSVDNSGDRKLCDCPDQTWISAGGAVNNTLDKVVVFHDPDGDDSTAVPLVLLDASETTDGTNLVWQLHADGFFEAA